MDSAIAQFLTKGTVVIAIMVVIANFFLKRIVEMIWPQLKATANAMDHKPMYRGKPGMWWNEIGLYALPVLIGANLGLVNDQFLFGPDIATTQGRVFYAAVVGWFADFLYTVVQKVLYKSTGVQLPSHGRVEITEVTSTVMSVQVTPGQTEAPADPSEDPKP